MNTTDAASLDSSRYSVAVAKLTSSESAFFTKNKDNLANQLDHWLYTLHTEIVQLKTRVSSLEEENRKLKEQGYNPVDTTMKLSEFFKNNKTADDLHIAIVKKVETTLQNNSKIENNILITGIAEENPNNDEEKVDKLLNVLDIDKTLMARKNRIRRKKTANNNNERPFEMIIVEFKDHATQQLALSNAHKLKDT